MESLVCKTVRDWDDVDNGNGREVEAVSVFSVTS